MINVEEQLTNWLPSFLPNVQSEPAYYFWMNAALPMLQASAYQLIL